MKILVTGGAGFLGRHVCTLLREHRENILAFDNLDPHCGGDGAFPHLHGSVTDYHELEHAICSQEITHIAHLAAYGRNLSCRDFSNDAWEVNVRGTRNVLRAAHFHRDLVKRVVVCSSNIVLSDQMTIYKMTKIAAEMEIQFYADLGVSCMGLRPSNIYGSGQSRTEHQLCAFAGLDESYKRDRCFHISGDGTQTRDWIHAEDVSRAFALALGSDVKGNTLDVCTGRQTSMNEIAKMLSVPVVYTDPRPGDAQALISDPGPAGVFLGFHATQVLEDRIWDAFPNVPRSVSA